MEVHERLKKLEHRVTELELELRKLKAFRSEAVGENEMKPLSHAPSIREEVRDVSEPVIPASEMPANEMQEDERQRLGQSAHQTPSKRPVDWEHLLTRVWLPRIFIVVFLIGVLWGFTAAVNAGYITEPVRCLLGIIAALFMYWMGERQLKHKRSALGQVLIGGAVAVLILSISAAHLLYHLIPSIPAFILYLLTIGLGLYASLRHRSQALMSVIIFAGYLIPFLLDTAEPNTILFVIYEAVFSIAMILIAYRLSYRSAMYLAFLLLHLPLLIGYFIGDGESRFAFLAAVVIQHILLYVLFTLRNQPTIKAEGSPSAKSTEFSGILFAAFGLLAGWTKGLYYDDFIYEYMYVLVVIAATLLYSVTAVLAYQKGRAFSVYLAIATFGGFLLLVEWLSGEHLAAALVAEGVIALLLGIALRSRMQQMIGWIIFFIGSMFTISMPIYDVVSRASFAWLTLLAAILLFILRVRQLPADSNYQALKPLFMWGEAFLLLVFLTQITNAWTEPLSGDMSRIILSGVWIAYAIIMILIGIFKHYRQLRIVGVLFLLFTLLKVIFFDLPDVSTAVRAILFLGLGAVGVAVSRLFYRNSDNKGAGK